MPVPLRYADFVQELNPTQRRGLGFWGHRQEPAHRSAPGEGCWRKVLAAVAPADLTRAVLDWQLSQRALPALLAIDGKTLHRGLATLVTLCDATTGEPLAQLARGGPGHEKTLAPTLVDGLP
ncbi:MAG: hypothetical protein EXS43_11670, partial [Opitutus sp.]|nr:hypothetical protein [Opitutus sp.]